MFQTYVQSALAFSIKRGGILYGSKDEEGNVTVHAIYEPPQVGHTVTTSVTAPAVANPQRIPCHVMFWGRLLEHREQLVAFANHKCKPGLGCILEGCSNR